VNEKTGLELSEEEQSFIEVVVSAKREEDIEYVQAMYKAGYSMYKDGVDRLFYIADRILESKKEASEIGQAENTINVPECISAIELRHFCKNENFQLSPDIKVPLGFGLFWEQIVPLLVAITDQVGCRYVYLYAADNTDDSEEKDARKLIAYYKNALKFSECYEGIKLVKPEYDNYCYGLIQKIVELKLNREAVWHEFSDVWDLEA